MIFYNKNNKKYITSINGILQEYTSYMFTKEYSNYKGLLTPVKLHNIEQLSSKNKPTFKDNYSYITQYLFKNNKEVQKYITSVSIGMLGKYLFFDTIEINTNLPLCGAYILLRDDIKVFNAPNFHHNKIFLYSRQVDINNSIDQYKLERDIFSNINFGDNIVYNVEQEGDIFKGLPNYYTTLSLAKIKNPMNILSLQNAQKLVVATSKIIIPEDNFTLYNSLTDFENVVFDKVFNINSETVNLNYRRNSKGDPKFKDITCNRLTCENKPVYINNLINPEHIVGKGSCEIYVDNLIFNEPIKRFNFESPQPKGGQFYPNSRNRSKLYVKNIINNIGKDIKLYVSAYSQFYTLKNNGQTDYYEELNNDNTSCIGAKGHIKKESYKDSLNS